MLMTALSAQSSASRLVHGKDRERRSLTVTYANCNPSAIVCSQSLRTSWSSAYSWGLLLLKAAKSALWDLYGQV